MSLSTVFDNVDDGSHDQYVRAFDAANNVRTASVTFNVDLTAPALKITVPADSGIYAVAAITAEWSATDGSSGVLGYGYRIDSGQWSALSMTGSHALVGLSEGTHTVEVYALDNVLNNATASVTFIVDTTAPTVTITTPSEGQFSSSPSISVTWSGDDSGVGVQAYQYRINGGAWSSNTTETGHTFDLPDGAYTVDVRVYDRANNTATDSTAFTVDTTAPEVEISAPANGHFTNSTTVQVNWNGSDATAGVRGYQYRIDSGLWSSEAPSQSSDFSGLTDGPHTVYVRVFDRSGNMAETNVSFTVDTVGPQLGIVTPTAAQILDRSDVNVSWSGSDLTTWIAGYRYSLDGLAWSPLSMDTYNVFTGLGEGDHTVQIMAYDHEYNPSFNRSPLRSIPSIRTSPSSCPSRASSATAAQWT